MVCVCTCVQGAVTKVKGLIGWDNKGTVQHMAKMSYMTERADRLEGLGVRQNMCFIAFKGDKHQEVLI